MNTNITQWNKYASLYNKGKGESGDELHNTLIQPTLEKLLTDLKGKNLLDIGCGNGFLEKWLSSKADQVIAVDSLDDLLEYAKNNSKYENVIFKKSDLTQKLLFADRSFDVVISVMVIQYLPEIKTLAAEIERILKEDGVFIFAIDHPAHALYLRAQELAGKKNEKFINSGSYFDKGLRKKHSLWNKAILQYYHRTISDYLNEFSKYLKLDLLEEISDDGEVPRISYIQG